MFRFFLRLIGLALVAAGFVAVVIDGTRSIANNALSFTSLGEVAFAVFKERYLLLQPAIEHRVHPLLWDPVVLNLTLAPASLVALVLGVFFLWLGRRPKEPIGYLARR